MGKDDILNVQREVLRMGIEQFNNENVITIQKKIKEALLSLQMMYGVDIDFDDINYSDIYMTGKLSITLNNSDAVKKQKEGQLSRIREMLRNHEFSEDLADKTFIVGKKKTPFKIVDVDWLSISTPFVMSDGVNNYRVSSDSLRTLVKYVENKEVDN